MLDSVGKNIPVTPAQAQPLVLSGTENEKVKAKQDKPDEYVSRAKVTPNENTLSKETNSNDSKHYLPPGFLQLFPNKEIAQKYYQAYLCVANKSDFDFFSSSLNQLTLGINELKKFEMDPKKQLKLEGLFYMGAGFLINGNDKGFEELLRSIEIKKKEGTLTRAFTDTMQTIQIMEDERQLSGLFQRAYSTKEQLLELEQKEFKRLINEISEDEELESDEVEGLQAHLTEIEINLKIAKLNRKNKIAEGEFEVQKAYKKLKDFPKPENEKDLYKYLTLAVFAAEKVINLTERKKEVYSQLAKELDGDDKETALKKVEELDKQVKHFKEEQEENQNKLHQLGAVLYLNGDRSHEMDFISCRLDPIISKAKEKQSEEPGEPKKEKAPDKSQITDELKSELEEIEKLNAWLLDDDVTDSEEKIEKRRKIIEEYSKSNFYNGLRSASKKETPQSRIDFLAFCKRYPELEEISKEILQDRPKSYLECDRTGKLTSYSEDLLIDLAKRYATATALVESDNSAHKSLKQAIVLEQNLEEFLHNDKPKLEANPEDVMAYANHYHAPLGSTANEKHRYIGIQGTDPEFAGKLNPHLEKTQEKLKQVIESYEPAFNEVNERAARVGQRLQPLVLLIKDTQRFEELETKKQELEKKKQYLSNEEEKELIEIKKRGVLTDRGISKEKLQKIQNMLNEPQFQEDLKFLADRLPKFIDDLSVVKEDSEIGKPLVAWRKRFTELNKYFGPKGEFSSALCTLQNFDPAFDKLDLKTYAPTIGHWCKTSSVIILGGVTCSLLAGSVVGAPEAGAGFLELAAYTAESFAARGVGMTIGNELSKEAVATYEPGFEGSRFLKELREGKVSEEAWDEIKHETASNILYMAAFSAFGKASGWAINKGGFTALQRARAFTGRLIGEGGESFSRRLATDLGVMYSQSAWEQGWESIFANSEVKFSDNPAVDSAIKVAIGSLASLWNSLGVHATPQVKEKLITQFKVRFNENTKQLEIPHTANKNELVKCLAENGFVIGKVTDTTIEAMLGGHDVVFNVVKEETQTQANPSVKTKQFSSFKEADLVKTAKDPERLFIQMEGFGRNTEWAGEMEKAIEESVERIDEFGSLEELTDSLAKVYTPAIKEKIEDERRATHSLINAFKISDDAKKKATTEFDEIIDRVTINRELVARSPISGGFEPYKERADKLINSSDEKPKTITMADLILSEFPESIRAEITDEMKEEMSKVKVTIRQHTMTGKIGEDTIELTKTNSIETDEGTFLVWVHTDPSNFPKIQAHINNLFNQIRDIKKGLNSGEIQRDENTLKTLTRLTAEMHWCFAHMMPYSRGSGGIGDMLSKVIFDSCGIITSKWKQGVAPDLEAFVTPQDQYIESYGNLSEKPLRWAREVNEKLQSTNLNDEVTGIKVKNKTTRDVDLFDPENIDWKQFGDELAEMAENRHTRHREITRVEKKLNDTPNTLTRDDLLNLYLHFAVEDTVDLQTIVSGLYQGEWNAVRNLTLKIAKGGNEINPEASELARKVLERMPQQVDSKFRFDIADLVLPTGWTNSGVLTTASSQSGTNTNTQNSEGVKNTGLHSYRLLQDVGVEQKHTLTFDESKKFIAEVLKANGYNPDVFMPEVDLSESDSHCTFRDAGYTILIHENTSVKVIAHEAGHMLHYLDELRALKGLNKEERRAKILDLMVERTKRGDEGPGMVVEEILNGWMLINTPKKIPPFSREMRKDLALLVKDYITPEIAPPPPITKVRPQIEALLDKHPDFVIKYKSKEEAVSAVAEYLSSRDELFHDCLRSLENKSAHDLFAKLPEPSEKERKTLMKKVEESITCKEGNEIQKAKKELSNAAYEVLSLQEKFKDNVPEEAYTKLIEDWFAGNETLISYVRSLSKDKLRELSLEPDFALEYLSSKEEVDVDLFGLRTAKKSGDNISPDDLAARRYGLYIGNRLRRILTCDRGSLDKTVNEVINYAQRNNFNQTDFYELVRTIENQSDLSSLSEETRKMLPFIRDLAKLIKIFEKLAKLNPPEGISKQKVDTLKQELRNYFKEINYFTIKTYEYSVGRQLQEVESLQKQYGVTDPEIKKAMKEVEDLYLSNPSAKTFREMISRQLGFEKLSEQTRKLYPIIEHLAEIDSILAQAEETLDKSYNGPFIQMIKEAGRYTSTVKISDIFNPAFFYVEEGNQTSKTLENFVKENQSLLTAEDPIKAWDEFLSRVEDKIDRPITETEADEVPQNFRDFARKLFINLENKLKREEIEKCYGSKSESQRESLLDATCDSYLRAKEIFEEIEEKTKQEIPRANITPQKKSNEVVSRIREWIRNLIGSGNKEIQSQECEEIYQGIISRYYNFLRFRQEEGPYSGKSVTEPLNKHDENYLSTITTDTEKIRHEEDEDGIFIYRLPKDHVHALPRSGRYSFNVIAHPELFAKLDEFISKHGGYYKVTKENEAYNERHDPITLYSYYDLSSQEELELAEIIRPYARDTDSLIGREIYDVNGKQIPGIKAEKKPTKEELFALLDKARSLDPALGEVIARCIELDKNPENPSTSSGYLNAMTEVINNIEQGNIQSLSNILGPRCQALQEFYTAWNNTNILKGTDAESINLSRIIAARLANPNICSQLFTKTSQARLRELVKELDTAMQKAGVQLDKDISMSQLEKIVESLNRLALDFMQDGNTTKLREELSSVIHLVGESKSSEKPTSSPNNPGPTELKPEKQTPPPANKPQESNKPNKDLPSRNPITDGRTSKPSGRNALGDSIAVC